MKGVPHGPAWWADPVMQRTPARFYAEVARRSPSLQSATLHDVTHDPALAATVALLARFRDVREAAAGYWRRTA